MTHTRPVTEEDERFILHINDLVCMEEYDQYSWLDNVLKRSFLRVSTTNAITRDKRIITRKDLYDFKRGKPKVF